MNAGAPPARTDQTGNEFFLAYQYPPPLWGDKKLYRVYRDPVALVFLHLGIFFDGVDFGALARSTTTQPDVKLMAAGVGVLVAGAEKLGAKLEEPKLRARLEAVEAMSPHERLLEAAKKPNVLASAKDLTEVKFVPWEGYKGPWATSSDGELMASMRFRLQSGGKYDVNIRDGADLALAIRWTQELLGAERVEVKFQTDAPPPVRR